MPIAATLLASLPPAEGIGQHSLAVGIDISSRMIEHARRLALHAGLRNVECEVDDAQSPATVKGPFDTISSSLVLFFLAEPLTALRNWRPLLKPGGRVGVTTFDPLDPRWIEVDEVFEPHLPPEMKDARITGKAGTFASDEGVEGLLREAGFTNVTTQSTSIDVRFADPQHWYDFTWSVGQRMMWLAIPEHLRADVRKDAKARLSQYSQPDGSITFTQEVRNTLGTRAAN